VISQNAAGRGRLCGIPDGWRVAVASSTTRSPTQDEIAAINARHLIETPLRQADLLFVFGTRESTNGSTRPAGCGGKGFSAGRS